MHTVNPFSAVALFLLVTISVKPRWAQSHSSLTPVAVTSAAAAEPGEWLIGTGRWCADYLVGSVSCNIAASVPGTQQPEQQHLRPYVHTGGLGGQSNVCTVAGVETRTHTRQRTHTHTHPSPSTYGSGWPPSNLQADIVPQTNTHMKSKSPVDLSYGWQIFCIIQYISFNPYFYKFIKTDIFLIHWHQVLYVPLNVWIRDLDTSLLCLVVISESSNKCQIQLKKKSTSCSSHRG